MATAEDVDPVDLTVVRHGYDRGQVRQRLSELSAAVERAEAERAEAVELAAELRGELEIARREIIALAERLETHGDEQSATRLLAVAKAQASEITARAKVAAEQTWAAAEQTSAELRDHYRAMLATLDEQHNEMRRTHKALLASTKTKVDQMTTEADRRREAIDKEAEKDRIRIDREFSESMATKREALRREIDTAKTESENEVTTRLAAADEEARRRIDTVTDQVKRLTTVREQLSGRLRETQELLELSNALLEPVEGESTEATAPAQPQKEPATKRSVPPQRQPAKS